MSCPCLKASTYSHSLYFNSLTWHTCPYTNLLPSYLCSLSCYSTPFTQCVQPQAIPHICCYVLLSEFCPMHNFLSFHFCLGIFLTQPSRNLARNVTQHCHSNLFTSSQILTYIGLCSLLHLLQSSYSLGAKTMS